MDSEQIVREIADRVREVISQAEEKAAQIVRDAEDEAKRIRARAESEGKDRLDEVREALDELQGRLGAGAPPHDGEAEVEPGPVVAPEPPPAPPPEPEPPSIPEPTPPPDEGTVPAAANGGPKSGDTTGARLVAINMALDGASREQIEARLAEDFELADAGALVDEVLALATK